MKRTMSMSIVEVRERTPELIDQLVEVWEASVRATHMFLSPAEIDQIKQYVPQALKEASHLVVAVDTAGGGADSDRDKTGAAPDVFAFASGTSADKKDISGHISGRPVAFMGVNAPMLEMLFVAPDQRGKGVGKKLIRYGIDRLGVTRLAVNEQNPQARGFYEHIGFTVYKRTDRDEQGQPYPLLYMRLR